MVVVKLGAPGLDLSSLLAGLNHRQADEAALQLIVNSELGADELGVRNLELLLNRASPCLHKYRLCSQSSEQIHWSGQSATSRGFRTPSKAFRWGRVRRRY